MGHAAAVARVGDGPESHHAHGDRHSGIEQHSHDQSLSVTVTVTGTGATPTGSVVLSAEATPHRRRAQLRLGDITIPAGSLATGSDTLTARYTPDSASSSAYNGASGTSSVTVTQSVTTPTVTVTPASSSIRTTESLSVNVTVTGAGATPTGSVVLSSGSYTSSGAALNSGSRQLPFRQDRSPRAPTR